MQADTTAEIDSRFSAPEAGPTPWSAAEHVLEHAELYWLTAVRAGVHIADASDVGWGGGEVVAWESSDRDVGIDRATYFERCWPNSKMTAAFDYQRLFEATTR